MTDDINPPQSGLVAVLPLSVLALAFGAFIIFYATNGGTLSTAARNAPAIAHSNAPTSGAAPSTVR